MNYSKSFTLIELLVVIAIIGLLSSIVLVSTQGLKDKARITKSLEFSQSVQHTLGANAVGWWSFEAIEGGKVIDGSGYGNDGTVTGATVVAGLEQLGNALSFDGGDDYVQCGSGASLNISGDITVEAWVYVSSAGSGERAIVSNVNTSVVSGIHLTYGRWATQLSWIYNTGSGYYEASTAGTLVTDTWQHVVATFSTSNNTARLYLNGVQKATDSSASAYARSITGLKIGRGGFGGYFFNGLIDEVRIYTQALSITEIQKHYIEGLEKHQYAKE